MPGEMILSSRPEDEEVLKRAIQRRVDGFQVRIASCEDLILLKLSAGRPVDLVDAQELLSINRESIDRVYLDSQAARRGLGRELAEAFGKVG